MATSPVFDSVQNAQAYHGMLYKKEMPPSVAKDPSAWLSESATHDKILIDHSKNRVGNREGLQLLDMDEKRGTELTETKNLLKASHEQILRLETLSKAMEARSKVMEARSKAMEARSKAMETQKKALEEELTELALLKATHREMRHAVLEERRVRYAQLREKEEGNRYAGELRKDRETVRVRNEVAHGGDILGDMKAIQYIQKHELPHASQYVSDFQAAYGIPFDQACTVLSRYPFEVIRAFNIRTSVDEMHGWDWHHLQPTKAAIKQLATQIIDTASNATTDLQARFENGGDLLIVFNEMSQLFGS